MLISILASILIHSRHLSDTMKENSNTVPDLDSKELKPKNLKKSSHLSVMWNVPKLKCEFVRKETLEEVKNHFNTKEKKEMRVALVGEPGWGKTRTAVEYALAANQSYQLIAWFRASTLAELQICYLEFAINMGIMEANDPVIMENLVEKIEHYFENSSKQVRSLLVYDNISNDIMKYEKLYVPNADNIHVLYTSVKRYEPNEHAHVIYVDELKEKSSETQKILEKILVKSRDQLEAVKPFFPSFNYRISLLIQIAETIEKVATSKTGGIEKVDECLKRFGECTRAKQFFDCSIKELASLENIPIPLFDYLFFLFGYLGSYNIPDSLLMRWVAKKLGKNQEQNAALLLDKALPILLDCSVLTRERPGKVSLSHSEVKDLMISRFNKLEQKHSHAIVIQLVQLLIDESSTYLTKKVDENIYDMAAHLDIANETVTRFLLKGWTFPLPVEKISLSDRERRIEKFLYSLLQKALLLNNIGLIYGRIHFLRKAKYFLEKAYLGICSYQRIKNENQLSCTIMILQNLVSLYPLLPAEHFKDIKNKITQCTQTIEQLKDKTKIEDEKYLLTDQSDLERTLSNELSPSSLELKRSKIHVEKEPLSQIISVRFVPLPKPPIPSAWNLSIFNKSYFVKRTALHEKLIHAFPSALERESKKKEGFQSVVLTVCHGLGGVGKTQLALNYVYHTTQLYTHRVWFNAESTEQLMRDYRWFCDAFHIFVDEKSSDVMVIDKVKNWLSTRSEWLLVYDNAPDDQTLESFLPKSGSGDILVTSRYAHKWSGKKIAVDVLEEKEAIELVKRRIRAGDAEAKLAETEETALRELVKELGYLPLALAQAAAYIAECNITVADYLEKYRSYTDEILEVRNLSSEEYPKSVATTWLITMERIQKQLPIALSVLQGCAYLAPDKIPKEVLKDFLQEIISTEEKGAPKPLLFNQIMSCLSSYSMVNVNDQAEQQSVNIHRVVQQVIRSHLQKQAEQKEAGSAKIDLQGMMQKLLTSLTRSCPKGDEMKTIHSRRRWIEHFESLLKQEDTHHGFSTENRMSAMSQLGIIYLYDWSQPQKAKDYLEKVREAEETVYGVDHVNVAITLANLGMAYGALGNPQKQRDFLERALVIDEKYYGKDHVEVAKTLANLGNAYGTLGDWQNARELLERALAIQEKHYGLDHVEMAITLGSLGNAYGALGDRQKQRDLLERVLVILEKHYGKDHVEVAITLVNLGNAYGDLGNLVKARELFERALRIQEKHYGSNHVEVAKTLVNLSKTYRALGELQRARELFERARMIQKKHYGKEWVTHAPLLQQFIDFFVDEFIAELWYLQKLARGDLAQRKDETSAGALLKIIQYCTSLTKLGAYSRFTYSLYDVR